MQQEIRKKTAAGAISNLLGLLGKKGLALLINILLVKTLSVTGYGVFNLYTATMTMLGNLSFGTEKVVQRYFPLHAKGEKATAISLFSGFFLIRYLVIALLCLMAYLLCSLGLVDCARFSFPYVKISILAGCIFSGQMFVMIALNATYMEHKLINAAYVAGDFVKFILLLLFCKGQVGLAILFYTIGEALVFLVLAHRFYRKLDVRRAELFALDWRRLDFARYFHYVKYMVLASTGTYILSTNVDYYFIAYFMDNVQVGSYAFSTKIPFLLLMFAPSNLLFNVAVPVLINKVDNGAQAVSLHSHILLFLRVNVVAWSVLIALLFVNIKWIIAVIFSDQYSHTSGYILFWLIVLYAHVIKNVFEPVARAIEYTRAYLWTIYAAILNLVGNYILIPILGVRGALIATGLSMVLQGAGLSYAVARKIDLPLRDCGYSFFLPRVVVLAGILFLNLRWSGGQIWQVMAANIGITVILCIFFIPRGWLSLEDARFVNGFLPTSIQARVGNFIEKHW
jgi:O-antigen/teichoic acid export membrane protein